MNARGDGSLAIITAKLMMENYLHPDAIFDALGVHVEVTGECNVPDVVVEATRTTDGVRPVKKGVVKSRLADAGFGYMTLKRLDESDPDGDVKCWFETLVEMARS